MTTPLSLDQYGFMTTYSGLKVNPWNPDPNTILIEDIAHALSQICRFTGHVKQFYSVGEHSFLASKLVAPEHALEALLHDAHEAYCNDMSRPLKKHPRMSGYVEVEQILDRVIRTKFGLPEILTPAVKDVDNKLVVTEGRQLMRDTSWTEGYEVYDFWIACDPPHIVKQNFLQRFTELTSSPAAVVR